jgi:hypothetical protein
MFAALRQSCHESSSAQLSTGGHLQPSWLAIGSLAFNRFWSPPIEFPSMLSVVHLRLKGICGGCTSDIRLLNESTLPPTIK